MGRYYHIITLSALFCLSDFPTFHSSHLDPATTEPTTTDPDPTITDPDYRSRICCNRTQHMLQPTTTYVAKLNRFYNRMHHVLQSKIL